MSWKNVAPGLYQRPLGDMETGWITNITADRPHPREPVRIHSIADFTAPYPATKIAQAFKEAWKALRLLKSPDIATTIDGRHKCYKVPSPEDLDEWLAQTFSVALTGTSVNAVVKIMQNRLELLPICHIVPQPTADGYFRGSLIIFISHWRTEAGGTFMMMNSLFDLAFDILNGTAIKQKLSSYVPESEVSLLTPALEEILMPNSKESSKESQSRVGKQFSDFYAHLPCIDFPIQGDISSPPSYMRLIQRNYTSTSTSALIYASKSVGIAITSAIHSAFLNAVYQVADPTSKDHAYACMMPAEVRKRLPDDSPYRDQGCWAAAQMLLLFSPAHEDFISRARSLRQQYTTANQDTWLFEDGREILKQLISPPADAPKQPASLPWFTSLGLLDGNVLLPDHGDLRINFVTAWADGLGPGIVLRLYTFRGRLNIHIQWNEAYHKSNQIDEVLNLLEQTIKNELKVDLVIEETRDEEY